MDKEVSKKEFTCKDNLSHEVNIGLLIFGCCVTISTIIGSTIGLLNHKIVLAEFLSIVLTIGICGIVLIVTSIHLLLNNSSCFFTINDEKVKLVGKRNGNSISIERNTSEIHFIVIKTFRKAKAIVLIDSVGEIGYSAASQKGEYIKVQYSKKKLEAIKRFLPDCSVVISENTSLGEV